MRARRRSQPRLLLETRPRADGRRAPTRRGGPDPDHFRLGFRPVSRGWLVLAGNPPVYHCTAKCRSSRRPKSESHDRSAVGAHYRGAAEELVKAWYNPGPKPTVSAQPARSRRRGRPGSESWETFGRAPGSAGQLAPARYFAAGNQLDSGCRARVGQALELETAVNLPRMACWHRERF